MRFLILAGLLYVSYRLFLAPKPNELDNNDNEIEYIDYEEVDDNE